MTVAAGATCLVRAGHVVHTHCGIAFDAVEEARKGLSVALDSMPDGFFEDSSFMGQLARVCTTDGLRGLIHQLARLVREKQDLLRQILGEKYEAVIAQLRAAAEKIRMGRTIVAALA